MIPPAAAPAPAAVSPKRSRLTLPKDYLFSQRPNLVNSFKSLSGISVFPWGPDTRARVGFGNPGGDGLERSPSGYSLHLGHAYCLGRKNSILV